LFLVYGSDLAVISVAGTTWLLAWYFGQLTS